MLISYALALYQSVPVVGPFCTSGPHAQWGLANYTRAGHLAVPSGRWAGWWDILPVFVVGWGCL